MQIVKFEIPSHYPERPPVPSWESMTDPSSPHYVGDIQFGLEVPPISPAFKDHIAYIEKMVELSLNPAE